jgi:late competence protein required for DNA uptake (superfamily II DNA/RNA helicase)
MGIITRWDNRNSKTTVLMAFDSEWTFDELQRAIEETDALIASVSHRVDVIVDVEGSKLPKDFLNMAKALLANPEPRANEGNRVIVGANNLIRQGYQLLQKTFGDKLNGREVHFADDLDTARAILRGLRETS